jgi:hypothetical protein
LHGNCLIRHVVERTIERRIEVRGRRGRRRNRLPGELEEKRWYWNFKAEAIDLTV